MTAVPCRRRRIQAVLLTALAVVAAACRAGRAEEPPLADVAVNRDAGGTDVGTSMDASLQPDGDNASPDVDGASNDPTNVPGDDGGAGDAMLDVIIDDVTTDSADPDAGTDDGGPTDDAPGGDADATDSGSPEDASADAAVPDGGDPTDAVFPTCAYMASIQATPYAIIDALPATAPDLVPCHCSGDFYARTYRVLCGSYTPPAIVNYNVCNIPQLEPGPREIFIVSALGCPRHPDAGADMWLIEHRPVGDWDALLTEQIAGHADSGGHD